MWTVACRNYEQRPVVIIAAFILWAYETLKRCSHIPAVILRSLWQCKFSTNICEMQLFNVQFLGHYSHWCLLSVEWNFVFPESCRSIHSYLTKRRHDSFFLFLRRLIRPSITQVNFKTPDSSICTLLSELSVIETALDGCFIKVKVAGSWSESFGDTRSVCKCYREALKHFLQPINFPERLRTMHYTSIANFLGVTVQKSFDSMFCGALRKRFVTEMWSFVRKTTFLPLILYWFLLHC